MADQKRRKATVAQKISGGAVFGAIGATAYAGLRVAQSAENEANRAARSRIDRVVAQSTAAKQKINANAYQAINGRPMPVGKPAAPAVKLSLDATKTKAMVLPAKAAGSTAGKILQAGAKGGKVGLLLAIGTIGVGYLAQKYKESQQAAAAAAAPSKGAEKTVDRSSFIKADGTPSEKPKTEAQQAAYERRRKNG